MAAAPLTASASPSESLPRPTTLSGVMNDQNGAIVVCCERLEFPHHQRHYRVVVHIGAATEHNERVEYE